MLTAVLALATARAALPDDVRLRPVAATAETIARFERWQAERDRPVVAPHCQELAIPEIQLCFRVWEGPKRRWVTEADRAQWGVTPDELRQHVVSDCVESIRRAELRTVEGGAQRYLALTDGDGWAVAGILCPSELAARLAEPGGAIRAALPTRDVLLAWVVGDPELDRIMAVAAREIHELQSHPLTPQVVHHDGERWRAFGRAIPSP